MKIISFIILGLGLVIACQPGLKTQDEANLDAGKTLYEQNCSGCHGIKVQAFADQEWKYGNSPEQIMATIKEGRAEGAMPSFAALFTEDDIKNIVAYIQVGIQQVGEYEFGDEFNYDTIHEHLGQKFRLEMVTDAADVPWGIAFLPGGSLVVTDRNGPVYLVEEGRATALKNVPGVIAESQGGMLDVAIHPDFENNKWIYLSYSKPNPNDSTLVTTAVSRFTLEGMELKNEKLVFEALPFESTRHHYGSRLVFGNDGLLYITVGDRGKRDDFPQVLSTFPGKVHRIKEDGSIPETNPFFNQENAVKSIFSFGHRNPQGMILDPESGLMWAHEHGPRGGDEINIVESGNNYGWPVISYGIEYNGNVFTTLTEKEGMEQPKHYWVPSIGPSGMAYLTGDVYPSWKGKILTGSLKYGFISMIEKNGEVLGEETRLLQGVGRTRSLAVSPDGYLFVGLEDPGRVYKIVPVKEEI
jgi:glucose/arabinose dehydrogenase/cytochrome c553